MALCTERGGGRQRLRERWRETDTQREVEGDRDTQREVEGDRHSERERKSEIES